MDLWKFAVFCATLVGVSAIRITKFEAPEKAQEGDTIILRCEYDLEGGPLNSVKIYHNNLQFYWYSPDSGGWAFPEKGMTVDLEISDDKQVVLKNVNVKLSGEYKCEVSLDKPLSTTVTAIHQISISKGGKLRDVKIKLPQNVQEGTESVVLQCTYNLDGQPLKEVTWYKDTVAFYYYKPGNPPSIEFIPQPGVEVLVTASNDKQVTLQNIKLETEGDYRCRVKAGTNTLQSLNADGHLTVTRVGRLNNVIITLPQNVQIGDKSAILECNYDLDGTRLNSVKWYKNGIEFYRFMLDENPSKQYFGVPGVTVDVNTSDDKHVNIMDITQQTSGTYRCEVQSVEPILQSLGAEAVLSVLNPKPPTSNRNFFDKAVGWFHNKWNDFRNRN